MFRASQTLNKTLWSGLLGFKCPSNAIANAIASFSCRANSTPGFDFLRRQFLNYKSDGTVRQTDRRTERMRCIICPSLRAYLFVYNKTIASLLTAVWVWISSECIIAFRPRRRRCAPMNSFSVLIITCRRPVSDYAQISHAGNAVLFIGIDLTDDRNDMPVAALLLVFG